MRELRGNMFKPGTYIPQIGIPNAICITTNGFVKADGSCVMGKGCAAEAKKLWPGIDKDLGYLIQMKGNHVHIIRHNEAKNTYVLSFPVKPVDLKTEFPFSSLFVVSHMRSKFRPGMTIPGWACVADIDLIRESAMELFDMADEYEWTKVVLPRPGCGAGELTWEKVSKAIDFLDDRFYTITF